MIPADLQPLLIGPFALLVGALIAVTILWRKVNELYKALDRVQEERLKDAKDAKVLAQALVLAEQRREDRYGRNNS